MTQEKPESIARFSCRAFFGTFFKVLGFIFGLVPLVILMGLLASYQENQPERKYKIAILPNADGKREAFSPTKPAVLVIDLIGFVGSNPVTTGRIREILVESREGRLEENLVQAVMLHLNTPGGTILDSDGIFHAVKEYKARYGVPIYAYVDGLCASGGMYIAAAADRIYASDTSLVGSVGVILSTFLNVSETLEKIGVKSTTLSAGEGKDVMNPFRQWKPAEADHLQFLTDFYYQQFVDLLTGQRPALSKSKLTDDYGAKVFPAKIAQGYGFIDHAGVSRDAVIQALATAAGLRDGNYQILRLEKEAWATDIFTAESATWPVTIEHQIQWADDLPTELHHQFLYLYRP